jgi:hypothetical protein
MKEKNFANNYEAIKDMTFEELTVFLDYVYTTGLNDGMYAAGLENESDEQMEIIGDCPYNEEWLSYEAEDATRHIFTEDNDVFLPEAFVKSVMRITGIDMENSDA